MQEVDISEVRQRIRSVFDSVVGSILADESEVFSFNLLAQEKGAIFDDDSCSLLIDPKYMGHHQVNMYTQPYHFNKILVLLNYIDQHLQGQIAKVNKRAVYYSLLSADIKSVAELDNYIADICQILHVSRVNLGIIASAKGLLAGGGIIDNFSADI